MDATKLRELIGRLRDPVAGCPWDREQTLASMARCIREEAAELAEALVEGDAVKIKEESGDLLWNLLFILELADEQKLFSSADVCEAIAKKMRRRHPHVYVGKKAATADEALAAYAEAKKKEKLDDK